MKTLAAALSDDEFADLNWVSTHLGLAPEAFVSRVLVEAVRRQKTRMLESRHAAGYKDHPIEPGEFDLHPDDKILRDTDEAW